MWTFGSRTWSRRELPRQSRVQGAVGGPGLRHGGGIARARRLHLERMGRDARRGHRRGEGEGRARYRRALLRALAHGARAPRDAQGAGHAGVAARALSRVGPRRARHAARKTRPPRLIPMALDPASVKALFFDVFGTMVDWRNGIARNARDMLAPKGFDLDWIAFADAWRAEYQPAMEEVRSGARSFDRLDVLHRRMLERVRGRFGLESLDAATLEALTLAWHRLDAWDDVKRAFPRLRQRFLMAPVSNGNIALMVDLARHNGIAWDTVLGAEIARDFKPKPRVYLAAAEALGLAPAQCMMVAAHGYDLQAAAAVGLRTAHAARPGESPRGEAAPLVPVDIAARSFEDLADQLGA